MAIKNKTAETTEDVHEFVERFAQTDQRKADSYFLVDWMKKISGFEPKMWGPSIIGFGSYHYKYASGHEGDAPLIGFSPRKAAISLYVFTGLKEHEPLLKGLGKYKMGKVCIYVNKLSDIDLKKLEVLAIASIKFVKKKYGKNQH